MQKISFDELLAKKEQREADQLRVGQIKIPGTDRALDAKMPPKKAVLEIYGEMASASNPEDVLACGTHALYACCPQLQDRELQTQLGVAEDPMSIIDALFGVSEQDELSGQVLRFLGLLPADRGASTESDEQNALKN